MQQYYTVCKFRKVQLCYLHIKGTKHFMWHLELGSGNIIAYKETWQHLLFL